MFNKPEIHQVATCSSATATPGRSIFGEDMDKRQKFAA